MNHSKNPYFKVLNKDGKKATVLINGSIGEWGENNNKRITNEIAALDADYDEITFLLNSPGGQVSEGIAIYHAIQNAKAKTTGVVVGLAASIAFVILQSFDKRIMKKATRAMSHKFSGGAYGSAKKMREMAKMMEEWETEVVDLIQERSGKDEATVKAWFKEEEDTWFSPKDMLKNGLIDEIDNSKTEKAPENISNDANALYNHYNAVVVNGLVSARPNKNGGNGKTQNSNSNKIKMKKEHLAIIGLAEGASDEAIANKLSALVESESVANTAKAMLQTNAENQVNAMIESGKLDKEQKEFAVNLLVEKPEQAGKFLNSLGGLDSARPDNDPLRPDQLIKASAGKGAGKGAGKKGDDNRDEWDLDMWMEKDPIGLDKLSDEEYDKVANRSNANSVK